MTILVVSGTVRDVVASNEHRDKGLVRLRIEDEQGQRQNVFVAYDQAKKLRLGMTARVILEVQE